MPKDVRNDPGEETAAAERFKQASEQRPIRSWSVSQEQAKQVDVAELKADIGVNGGTRRTAPDKLAAVVTGDVLTTRLKVWRRSNSLGWGHILGHRHHGAMSRPARRREATPMDDDAGMVC
jgi:hypothetical protein